MSAKDLVSSIISAANKKIRKRDKTTRVERDVPEIESEPSSYNERNIDREIELRRVKEQPPPAVAPVQLPPSKENSCSSLASVTESVTSVQLEVKHYPAYPASADFYSFSSEKRELTNEALQQIRRMEVDARALRQRDEQQRTEQQRHARARQQIELEMARTRRELEQDDLDLGSVTSDYSTLSTSTLEGGQAHLHNIVVKSPMGHRYLTSTTPMPRAVHDDLDICKVKERSQGRKGSLDSLLDCYDGPDVSIEKVPAVPAAKKDRRHRRRHTVGGENDLEHFKALMALNSTPNKSAPTSAWERLQPVVKNDSSRDMQRWLLQMRHHGSSPALLHQSRLSFSSPASPLSKQNFTFESSI